LLAAAAGFLLIPHSSLFAYLQILMTEKDKAKLVSTEKRKAADQETEPLKDLKKVKCHDVLTLFMFVTFPCCTFPQAKLETKALKAKRPGFTDDRYYETSYYIENGKETASNICKLN